MCHHTRVFWRCRARLAFGVWWLRHSMELSPYLEFLSFNTTTISHNPNPCTRSPHTNLAIPTESNLQTCKHVRQTHGHRARRRAPEPVRRRSHLCRASREGSRSTRRYDFLSPCQCATANQWLPQIPQQAPQSTRRPPTPARPTPKALPPQTRSDTDKVSKKAVWVARQQVQRVKRTRKVRQRQIDVVVVHGRLIMSRWIRWH